MVLERQPIIQRNNLYKRLRIRLILLSFFICKKSYPVKIIFTHKNKKNYVIFEDIKKSYQTLVKKFS